MKHIDTKIPIISLRDGSIKASIWENNGENGSYLSTTFTKTYTKDGKPADGNIFGRNDLLPLSELARKTYEKINLYRDLKKQSKAEQDQEPK